MVKKWTYKVAQLVIASTLNYDEWKKSRHG